MKIYSDIGIEFFMTKTERAHEMNDYCLLVSDGGEEGVGGRERARAIAARGAPRKIRRNDAQIRHVRDKKRNFRDDFEK